MEHLSNEALDTAMRDELKYLKGRSVDESKEFEGWQNDVAYLQCSSDLEEAR
jgi:hypothetical protein